MIGLFAILGGIWLLEKTVVANKNTKQTGSGIVKTSESDDSVFYGVDAFHKGRYQLSETEYWDYPGDVERPIDNPYYFPHEWSNAESLNPLFGHHRPASHVLNYGITPGTH